MKSCLAVIASVRVASNDAPRGITAEGFASYTLGGELGDGGEECRSFQHAGQ